MLFRSEVFPIVDPHFRQPAGNPIRDVLRAQNPGIVSIQTLLSNRSGSEVHVDASGTPVRNRDGKVCGAVLVFRDVSQRRLAEERMHRLAAIVEDSQDAMMSMTLGGIMTAWNAAAEEMFGYSAKEMIGQSVQRVVPPNQTEEVDRKSTRLNSSH